MKTRIFQNCLQNNNNNINWSRLTTAAHSSHAGFCMTVTIPLSSLKCYYELSYNMFLCECKLLRKLFVSFPTWTFLELFFYRSGLKWSKLLNCPQIGPSQIGPHGHKKPNLHTPSRSPSNEDIYITQTKDTLGIEE